MNIGEMLKQRDKAMAEFGDGLHAEKAAASLMERPLAARMARVEVLDARIGMIEERRKHENERAEAEIKALSAEIYALKQDIDREHKLIAPMRDTSDAEKKAAPKKAGRGARDLKAK